GADRERRHSRGRNGGDIARALVGGGDAQVVVALSRSAEDGVFGTPGAGWANRRFDSLAVGGVQLRLGKERGRLDRHDQRFAGSVHDLRGRVKRCRRDEHDDRLPGARRYRPLPAVAGRKDVLKAHGVALAALGRTASVVEASDAAAKSAPAELALAALRGRGE